MLVFGRTIWSITHQLHGYVITLSEAKDFELAANDARSPYSDFVTLRRVSARYSGCNKNDASALQNMNKICLNVRRTYANRPVDDISFDKTHNSRTEGKIQRV